MIIHFESPTGQKIFNSIAIDRLKVQIKMGDASEVFCQTVLKCKTQKEAQQVYQTWLSYLRSKGLPEFAIEDWIPATVTAIDKAVGARVRTDAADVFVDTESCLRLKLKQGSRILIKGIKKSAKKLPDIMLRSRLVASDSKAFPKPVNASKGSPLHLSASAAKTIAKQIGKDLLGGHEWPQKGVKYRVGDLILGYYLGIFRLVSVRKMHGGWLLDYDQVLDKKLKRPKLRLPDTSTSQFCKPLPKDLQDLILQQLKIT